LLIKIYIYINILNSTTHCLICKDFKKPMVTIIEHFLAFRFQEFPKDVSNINLFLFLHIRLPVQANVSELLFDQR